jgi:hypothetical protein
VRIIEKEFRQIDVQIQRGTKSVRLTLEGAPSQDNFFERLLFHADKLGYYLFKNGSYVAITSEKDPYNPETDYGSRRGKSYIMRINQRNKNMSIRYFPQFYPMNPLMKCANERKDGQLSNAINNENDLKLVMKMLEDHLKEKKEN